ncbi:TOMM precursor leader peptide-binding protein [Nonomuraea candida]|uniref:TOMM precursor leader peptide-binding protein n=1 Tax=Nonomuraea candida TaxID=359159 RepID=UPI000694E228|nr:TOMM precursor leader peptide-binding protein [Nonomuraea candida]
MDARPSFRRHYRVEVIEGEGVYLISERDTHVLTGRSIEAVAGLLDGKHTVRDILVAVEPDIPPENVYYVLHTLRRRDLLVDVTEDVERASAAYWEMAGLDARAVTASVRGGRAEVLTVGDVTAGELRDLLAAEGVEVTGPGEDAALTVVLTDDYMRGELAEINRRHLAEGRPWLLARTTGPVLWLGPVFRPGQDDDGGCWRCLSQRLEGHRQSLTYLEDRLRGSRPLALPAADLPLTRGAGARLVAAEAVKWLAGLRGPWQRDVVTIDTLRLDTARHALRRRPQCPACGDAGLMAAAARSPVVLRPRPKTFTADGGHRSRHPEDTAERYAHLVSPVTGVIRDLARMDTKTPFVKAYMAGHNFSRQVHNLASLRRGLRTQSAGKGMTDLQAKVSAMCEAMERYSGVFQGDEARIRASLRQLGADALHPNACSLYSETQYRTRTALAATSGYAFVNDPLDEDAAIEWTPVWSLTERRHKYLPTGYLYYYYNDLHATGPLYAWADSNGNAAGSSLEDAVVQGFMELVERDAVAVWWYNRVRRPAFDLATFGDAWMAEFQEVYAGLGRDLHVLDLTNDLGVPVAAAISRRVDGPSEDILMAFGAHFDVRIAVQRALAELNQFIPAVIDVGPDGVTRYRFPEQDQVDWWANARMADHPYLSPSGASVPASAYARPATGDLLDDVEAARALVEERGMEMLVLDQTRPDIGLPVVKVIVPGMRHFWRRLAPGRLYDVPVRLGWLAEPTPEEQMNPITMFL